MTVAMENTYVEKPLDVATVNYGKEIFYPLLAGCLPYLSVQDLDLISNEVFEYILSSDEEVTITSLFSRYPNAQLVLSVFREAFHTKIHEFQDEQIILDGKFIEPDKQGLLIQEIFQRFSSLLYQRLACYTAGLNIDLITALSATAYESKSPEGQSVAILPSLKWLNGNNVIFFDEYSGSVTLEQTQLGALRKQLNTCGNGALAIYKGEETGVYKTVGVISCEIAQQLPRFLFKKHAEWLFAVPGANVENSSRIRYCNGAFMLPVLNLRDVYIDRVKRLPLKYKSQGILGKIFDAVNECKHGAILIVADDSIIQQEVNRLTQNKRGTRLKNPIPLFRRKGNSTILDQLSAVDGAVFIDLNGKCHAFGVILDGIVSNCGKNARGSRYNSTKAYTEWIRDKQYPNATILGIVKSEDGMVDLFAESKPS